MAFSWLSGFGTIEISPRLSKPLNFSTGSGFRSGFGSGLGSWFGSGLTASGITRTDSMLL